MPKNPLAPLSNNLGEYLKEQREHARLSVRQLSDLAGVSNPYLSQIERGVKRPSADILQQIAKGLSISAETLYVQAGLLDPQDPGEDTTAATRAALRADTALTSRQRQTLLDIYDSFVSARPEPSGEEAKGERAAATTTPGAGTTTKATASRSTARRSTARKSPAAQSSATKSAASKSPAAKTTRTKSPATKTTRTKAAGRPSGTPSA